MQLANYLYLKVYYRISVIIMTIVCFSSVARSRKNRGQDCAFCRYVASYMHVDTVVPKQITSGIDAQ